MTSPPPALERLVGERTVPRIEHENYWFRRHEIAYLSLAGLITAAAGPGLVIEAGSGEGYGVRVLNRTGNARVAALDYDLAALTHSAGAYPDQVAGRALLVNLVNLPLATAAVDVITSFQVIEHLWDPDRFVAECARVLRPGGLLIVTTPNRLTFSPGLGRGQKPRNPFHQREFDSAELIDLVGAHLIVGELLAVSHGPRLTAWQHRHGNLIDAQLAVPADQWPAELAHVVRSVTAEDFVLAPPSPAQAEVLDLVVVAHSEVS